jgi:putative sigma-54 modulation protein
MNINIVGRHLNLTEGLKKYIEDKVSKLEAIIQPIHDIQVIISVQKKYIHEAEIVLKTEKERVVGDATSEDMYISIDLAVEKVSHHLQRMRDKLKDHKKISLKKQSLLIQEEVDRTTNELDKDI